MANGENIKVSHETFLNLYFKIQNIHFNVVCLVSPNLQSEEIIISWMSMMQLGMLIAPNSSIHQNNQQILRVDNEPKDLTMENKVVLKSPPPLEVFPLIPNDDPNWFTRVSEQGQLIKNQLLSAYPLAFTYKDSNEVSFAAVAPIKINVNLGVRPVNHTIEKGYIEGTLYCGFLNQI